jgi:hypothetical protein
MTMWPFFTDVSRETPTYSSFFDSLLQGVKFEVVVSYSGALTTTPSVP